VSASDLPVRGRVQEEFRLPGVPVSFVWDDPPAAPPRFEGGELTITAGPRTDLFADPAGAAPILNASRALAPISGDVQLLARVSVELVETFDAGGLLVWADVERWAKLGLERSREGEATIASVVTRRRSDDCVSYGLGADPIWLRISRMVDACAFHFSDDGVTWQLVRHFSIAGWEPLSAGVLVQSPRGTGTSATFSDVRLLATTLADIRSGS
jgi:regulation of enolase protein 1 (concanavalin A-like superfamily)